MKIALVSLDQEWEDKEKNITQCIEYVKKASSENVDLIVFPEMTLSGFSMNIEFISENEGDSKSLKSFQKIAKEYKISIIFGLVIKDGKKAKNRVYFINHQGKVLDSYDKIHPFSFAGEDKYFNSGDELTIIKFLGLNIGLSICYDLRFPELYSALAKECDVVINIANWPARRVDHWTTLLKARAIENQIFVIGVNRIGTDGNNLKYVKSSWAFNANGDLLEPMPIGNMDIVNISMYEYKNFIKSFSTTQDRKVDLYKGLLCQ